MRLLRLLAWLVLFVPALWVTAQESGREAYLLNIDGPIGPATSDYFHRALEQAHAEDAALVILRMDTPGGLDSAMRDIIKDILASPIPVVGYVAPSGARAASAGTYILYASHVAAMAPATNLGAATPVQLGGENPLPEQPEEPKADGKEKAPEKGDGKATKPPERPAAPKGDAMRHKVVNDAVAYIRGLAELRGRNADWAEQAVRAAASLDAQAALDKNVIDIVARNTDELLKKIDGRKVSVVGGAEVTLDTGNLTVVRIEPDWRSELLAVITNPNVAYILMLVGVYGLIFEFSNPGAVVPGVVGAICLLLALFAFQVLPINYAGVALILLGIALMVGEAFAPSFGILGIGGLAALVIGSIILIDTEAPGFGISPALIAAVALFSLVLFIAVLGLVARARKQPVVSGREEMVGSHAEVLDDFTGYGMVRAHGELWKASSDVPLAKGQRVRVTELDGLCLKVAPDDVKSPDGT